MCASCTCLPHPLMGARPWAVADIPAGYAKQSASERGCGGSRAPPASPQVGKPARGIPRLGVTVGRGCSAHYCQRAELLRKQVCPAALPQRGMRKTRMQRSNFHCKVERRGLWDVERLIAFLALASVLSQLGS